MKIESPDQYQQSIDNLKCLFYGQSGAGKTTLACSFPNPLIIDLEGGLGKNRPYRVLLDEYKDLDTLISTLQDEKYFNAFDTIVIDSLNELIEVLVRDEILAYQTKRIYDDQLTQGDYGKIGRDIGKLVRKMMAELSPYYNLVFLCAENPLSYEGEQRSYNMTGKMLPAILPRLMDIVGCVFTKGNDHLLTINNSSFAIGKNRYGVPATPFACNYDELLNQISE